MIIELKPANNNEVFNDLLLPFLVNKIGIHGNLVRLDKSLSDILAGHNYPDAISKLLAEMLLMVTAIGGSLKNETSLLSIQMQGDGPLKFIVADYRSEHNIRGYASIEDKEFFASKNYEDLTLKDFLSNGHLMVTYMHDTDVKKRYQGIVDAGDLTFVKAIEQYFHQSEQLDVNIKMAAEYKLGLNNCKNWFAQSIMIKKLPNENNQSDDKQWSHASILLNTITQEELLDINNTPNSLIYRLYHEDEVMVYNSLKISAKCRCSRERMFSALANMDQQTIEELKNEYQEIIITCEFCNREEKFNDKDFI